jgi:asparagine synthase (glutamine-hydrolysing)
MTHHVNRYAAAVPGPVRRLADTALRLFPASPRVEKIRRFNSDSFLEPMARFRRRITCMPDILRRDILRPAIAEAAADRAVDRFEEHLDNAAARGDDRMLYLDTVMYLPDDILTKVDRMSMAHGLEARVPLLDHRLVEFAACVPFALKFDGRHGKVLARHAVRELLPTALRKPRKQGFAIPIQRWFREELADCFRDLVFGPDARCAQWLRRDAIEKLFYDHLEGRENYGHPLWTLLNFEQWLRNR